MVSKAVGQKTMVPDTLDLAWHGSLAINGILGPLNPDLDYERYCLAYFSVHPAYMIHASSMISGIHPKFVEGLPLLRQMTGSTAQLDIEKGFIDAVLANCADDGMIYDRAVPERPWNTGVYYGVEGWNEDYAHLGGNGRLLAGFVNQYKATADESWREHARRLAERMLELIVTKGDYAYIPYLGLGNDFSYPRKSGWTHTKEPVHAQEGAEAAAICSLAMPIRGFVPWYKLTGDERFLEMARKLARFCLLPRWWGAPQDIEPLAGAQHGHFWGHWHAYSSALLSLLEYAAAADDFVAKQFVRDSYEFTRQVGIHRLGVFPSSHPVTARPGVPVTEGCSAADMVMLAIGMTDAGLGDYWDDVEQTTRNVLVEMQASSREEMERVSMAGRHRPINSPWGDPGDGRFRGRHGVIPGQESVDRVIERTVGGFGAMAGARHILPIIGPCDSANCPIGMYAAWEGILRREGEAANVNLWMNRRSPWADVWSWLPYEGKVMVRNKGMKRITVRLPGWTSRRSVAARVNGQAAQPEWIGNRAVFAGLKGNEEIVMEVPVKTEKASYTLSTLNLRRWQGPDTYNCEFRGHTAISVGEPPSAPTGQPMTEYRIFQREHMRAAQAPMKEMPAYVHPENLVQLTVG